MYSKFVPNYASVVESLQTQRQRIDPLSDAGENSDSTVEFVAAIRGLHGL